MRVRSGIESVVAVGLLLVAGGAYLFSGAFATPPSPARVVAPPGPPTAGPVPAPTSNDVDASIPTCRPNDVDAVVMAWAAVGDSRVATVHLDYIGDGRNCLVWRTGKVGLYGNGELLIQGAEGSPNALVEIVPGVVLYTVVRADNYCGPKPVPAVTVAILQDDGFYVATPLSPDDVSGVPPCVDKSASATIEMDPWRPVLAP